MSVGATYNQGVTSVAPGGYFSIQPSGIECVIHNISHSTDAVLEFYDGTTAVVVDTQLGNGSWMGMFLHCTFDKYYRVKNINGTSNNICCDGVITLED